MIGSCQSPRHQVPELRSSRAKIYGLRSHLVKTLVEFFDLLVPKLLANMGYFEVAEVAAIHVRCGLFELDIRTQYMKKFPALVCALAEPPSTALLRDHVRV